MKKFMVRRDTGIFVRMIRMNRVCLSMLINFGDFMICVFSLQTKRMEEVNESVERSRQDKRKTFPIHIFRKTY